MYIAYNGVIVLFTGQFKSVLLLLMHGARVSVLDKRGYTPLQQALLREQADIAILLIQHGAYLHTYSKSTDSPLKMCCKMSNAVLVKCMLDGGCDLSLEPWFSVEVIKEKLRELDYVRSSRFHRKNSRELWESIKSSLEAMPSLLQTTRLNLRRHLLYSSGGKSVAESVKFLNIPPVLKRYLTLDDVYYA